MADKTISELTQATQITNEDMFVLQQNGVAKKLPGETLLKFIMLNVVSVTVTTLPAGSSATATYDKSTNTLALGIPQGKKGDTGATGATGPANVLTIGSVTSGKVASATITGEAPNQVLNLVLKEGEQGPEGPVGGSSNFVRYDAAQTLTDAQKTQARGNINAALGGFGWGEELPRQVSTAAEIDAITSNSIVRYANDSTNMVDGDSGSYTRYAIVVTYTVNATDKAQDVYCYGGGAHGDVMLHRGRLGNTWLPWEYVNPPMQLGVEYRTTERYLGKPVYVKVVDFGFLPNNTLKTVTLGDTSIMMISAHGIMGNGYVIPGCTGSSDYPSQEMQILTANGGVVGIMTHTDRSTVKAVIVTKYWKTTD